MALTWAPSRGNKPRSVKATEPKLVVPFDPDRFHFGKTPAHEWLVFVDVESAVSCATAGSPGHVSMSQHDREKKRTMLIYFVCYALTYSPTPTHTHQHTHTQALLANAYPLGVRSGILCPGVHEHK